MTDRERSGTCFLAMASIRGARQFNNHCLCSLRQEAVTLLCGRCCWKAHRDPPISGLWRSTRRD